MGEASAIESEVSTVIGCTSVPRREQMFPGFSVAARALWPRKTAAHIAAATGVSERAAKFWLAGDREPSPEAFQVIFNKIMERRRSA